MLHCTCRSCDTGNTEMARQDVRSGGKGCVVSPCRDALWRILFWQPLLAGVGFYLVTLLSLAAALWASLALQSGGALWRLLR
jgi:hypothetical protein